MHCDSGNITLLYFGGHRHSDSRDIMVLVCHVISKDQVIKGSYDFMSGNHSWYFTILENSADIGVVIVDI